MTSGRLTPAAATLIRTSPTPAAGLGRSVSLRTSGEPGLEISTVRIRLLWPAGPLEPIRVAISHPATRGSHEEGLVRTDDSRVCRVDHARLRRRRTERLATSESHPHCRAAPDEHRGRSPRHADVLPAVRR